MADEVDRAKVETAHLARGVGACTDEDDRDVLRLGVLLQADKHIEPVHVPEVDIEDTRKAPKVGAAA